MIQDGKIVLDDELATIKQEYCQISIRFENSLAVPPVIAGALHLQGDGRDWSALWAGDLDQLQTQLTNLSGRLITKRGVSLDEIFVAYAGGEKS